MSRISEALKDIKEAKSLHELSILRDISPVDYRVNVAYRKRRDELVIKRFCDCASTHCYYCRLIGKVSLP